MSSLNTPSKTTPRRVLGDIGPNAINTSLTHGTAPHPSEATRAQSPLKQIPALPPQLFLGKENAVREAAYPQGKKRSIHEVDGVEMAESVKAMFGAREPAQSPWKAGLTAAGLQRHTEYDPVHLPPPGSHTERNTPSPEPEELAVQGQSQDSQSFSNLFDFSGICASQSQKSEHPPPSPTPSPPPEENKEKSKAELLRTRLIFAQYKVKTNQTTKRSSEIISTWESSSPEAAITPITTAITSSGETTESHAVPNITLSATHRNVEFISIKANLDPGRPIGNLSAAPVLVPTAYSSRMPQEYNIMPSSPPQQSVSPEQLLSPVKSKANFPTPVPANPEEQDQIEYSFDEPIETRIERLHEERVQEGSGSRSSVVKGNAAEGLMDLMQSRR